VKIVADENMPFAREAFGTLGQVVTAPGRGMTRELLADADILAVRSVTNVGPELLEGTPVKFVGTATIGTDHVDRDYLRDRNIGFASAPGCNAVSVGEYVTAALFVLAERGGYRLAGKTIGIVGVGNVGSRVAARAEALGMRVLLNDPPLARRTGDAVYRPLDELFEADFVTLHVPLTREGEDATYRLAGAALLARMKPGSVLLNTSRGKVVDGAALRNALDGGHLSAALLDVWETEPGIDMALLDRVAIGTPHVAGYSFDGKVRGTTMIVEAACKFLGQACTWDPGEVMPPSPCPELTLDAAGRDDEDVLAEAVGAVYDILADDRRLRAMAALPDLQRGPAFDRLRRDYPVRREFAATNLTLLGASESLLEKCRATGFNLQ